MNKEIMNRTKITSKIVICFILLTIGTQIALAELVIDQAGALELNQTHPAFLFSNLSYVNFESSDISFAGEDDVGLGHKGLPLYAEYGGRIETGTNCAGVNFSSTIQEVVEGSSHCLLTKDKNYVINLYVEEIATNWSSVKLAWKIIESNQAVAIESVPEANVTETKPLSQTLGLNILFILINISLLIGLIIVAKKMLEHH
jgi:hypothetical protein